MKELLCKYKAINLIIEAPLYAKFQDNGNPERRGDFERKGNSTRYWYQYGGLLTFIATGFLIKKLAEYITKGYISGNTLKCKEIRFFEGFVSFKESESNHKEDVKKLSEAIQVIVNKNKNKFETEKFKGRIVIERVKDKKEDQDIQEQQNQNDNGIIKIINIFHMFVIDKFNDIIEVPAAHEAPLVIVIENK